MKRRQNELSRVAKAQKAEMNSFVNKHLESAQKGKRLDMEDI